MAVRWQDWISVALGSWLAISPWAMNYWLDRGATENAFGVGAVIIIFNLISVCRLVDEGQELFNILLGAWLVLSPLWLDFAAATAAMINTVLVGSMIIGLAVWQIRDATK
jgi:hypothetical protein